jgi:LysM domain-containing protein
MSAMTAGEQKRRAGAARGRPQAAGTPGQQTVTAGERPGPATSRRRNGAAGQRTRHLTVVPPPQPSNAAPPAATAAAPTRGHAVPPKARGSQSVPPQATASQVMPPETARHGTARHGTARHGAARPGIARPQGARLTQGQAAWPGAAQAGGALPETAQARPVRTRVRLTRRGRIVVAALITACVVLVVALAWLAGTARAEAAGSGSPASAVYHSLRSVVVQPGESLWTIATQADPAGDPRTVMQEIIDINALHGTSVQPGQRLWLPRG